ncbi:MAG: hypothetical protein ACEQSL_08155, partial [Sediminibacterium sp.]
MKKIIALFSLLVAWNVAFSQDSLFNELRHATLLKVEKDSVISKFNFEVAAGLDRSREISNLGYSAVLNYSNVFQNEKNKLTLSLTGAVFHFPEFNRRYLDSLGTLPGFGRVLTPDSGATAFAAIPAIVYSRKLNNHFTLSVGNSRRNLGYGYRSLVLSSSASALPFMKLETKIGKKITFTNLWSRTHSYQRMQNHFDLNPKYVAVHTLEWKINKKWSVSAHEMVVWQARDSASHRELDLHYLNPFLFYRPAEFSQGSADNVLLGGSWKYKRSEGFEIFGQVILDEFLAKEIRNRNGWWGNKFGMQLGMRIAPKKIPGLNFQTEWSFVRPFTYTHGSDVQAWEHMGQPLAHPLGANFYEWYTSVQYQHQKWNYTAGIVWGAFGRDAQHNVGGNIFQSYVNPWDVYGNKILQGNRSTLFVVNAEAAYQMTPALQVFGFARFRSEDRRVDPFKEAWLMLGI